MLIIIIMYAICHAVSGNSVSGERGDACSMKGAVITGVAAISSPGFDYENETPYTSGVAMCCSMFNLLSLY